jgi:mandelate racemase
MERDEWWETKRKHSCLPTKRRPEMAALLTVRAIHATAVEVPMTRPLGTSAQTMRTAPLLLIDLETEEGITGRAYLFCYTRMAPGPIAAVLADIQDAVRGECLAPVDLSTRLQQHYRLLGAQGIVRMALAGFDVACWDALSLAAGLPLASYIGSQPRPIPAYNSNGLGLMSPEQAADEAEALLEQGFQAVKLRLGRATAEQDLAVVRAVRRRLPDTVALMTDYNQALTVTEAIRRGQALDGEGVYWIEEPTRHDDYAGCARIAAALKTPVQIGENFAGASAMATALAADACDYAMPDLERIGGITGWQRAAALASAVGIEMSSHIFPEVSAHLLAATPTCHWLEYVDWAAPILAEPLRIVDGLAQVPDRPGSGVAWDTDAVKRFRIT